MLTTELSNLFDALDAADFDPPHDLAAALDALPPAGTLPAPHDTWTLLALARYGARKLWAHRAIHTRLAPAWARRHGSRPLEEATGRFILPGRPDWDAELDGNDSYLVHRTTGERVHVDMLNGPGLFSRGRFARYLLEHRQPRPGRAAGARTPPAVRGPAPDAGRPDDPPARSTRWTRTSSSSAGGSSARADVHRRVPRRLGGPAPGRASGSRPGRRLAGRPRRGPRRRRPRAGRRDGPAGRGQSPAAARRPPRPGGGGRPPTRRRSTRWPTPAPRTCRDTWTRPCGARTTPRTRRWS